MAQQSARRGRKNQAYSSCPERAFMIWLRSANSHTGPAASSLHHQRPDRWQHPITCRSSSKNRLHLAGRPQMSTRPREQQNGIQGAQHTRCARSQLYRSGLDRAAHAVQGERTSEFPIEPFIGGLPGRSPTPDIQNCRIKIFDIFLLFIELFQHAFPHERSHLRHWHKRLGDKRIA